MRYVHLIVLVALTGCAHLSHQDPQTGLEVTYTGSANGAVKLVRATDPRPYDLASKAVDKGMSTSLTRDADGDVRFTAGYGYTYASGSSFGPGGVGYAPANTGYIPGQGFVVGPRQSTLPPLATSVVTVAPGTQANGGAIVPCPKDRVPATVSEQAACTTDGVLSLTRNRTK